MPERLNQNFSLEEDKEFEKISPEQVFDYINDATDNPFTSPEQELRYLEDQCEKLEFEANNALGAGNPNHASELMGLKETFEARITQLKEQGVGDDVQDFGEIG